MTERKGKLENIAFVTYLVLVASLAIQKPSAATIARKELAGTDLIFPVVFVLAVLAWLVRREIVFRRVYWFLFAYVAAFIVASLFAENTVVAFTKTAATLYLVLIAVVTSELVNNSQRLHQTIIVFLCSSAVPTVVGLLTILIYYAYPESGLLPYLTYHYGAVPVGNYPRLSSTFVSASMFCNFLNAALMLFLISRSKRWVNAKLVAVGVIFVLVCAAFTISSGLGSILLALGIWYWYLRRESAAGRSVLAAGILSCAVFFGTGFIALQKHSTAPYSFKIPVVGIEAYPSPRLLVWTEAFNNFLNDPVTGRGPGSRSAAVLFENSEGAYSLLTDAHNSYLSVATQTGILGLLALIALSVYLLREGIRSRSDTIVFGLALAFFSAFVVQGMMGSFEDARHLWFLIGLLIAAIAVQGRSSTA